jgi:hypothetical protein
MMSIKSNFHELHVLKNAKPKLRKAMLSNCNKELINTISECVLNVLKGNEKITLSKRRLHKFSGQFRSVAGRRVALTNKKSAFIIRNFTDCSESYLNHGTVEKDYVA